MRRDVDDVTFQSVYSFGDVTLESMTLKSVHCVEKRASLWRVSIPLKSVYRFIPLEKVHGLGECV